MCPPVVMGCRWSHGSWTHQAENTSACLPALCSQSRGSQANSALLSSLSGSCEWHKSFPRVEALVFFPPDKLPLRLYPQSTAENQTSLTVLPQNFWEVVSSCGGTLPSFLPGESTGKDHPGHTKVIFFSKASSNLQLYFSYR